MFKEIIKTINFGNETLEISTGKLALQADGAVTVKMGDSIVLCTAVCAKSPKDDVSFFPLTVHYREMFFAAGKIPGGFSKREGRVSDKEALVSRLIDRPIRPLFHPEFYNETQIICTVLSYDSRYNTDILAMIGASAALALTGAPVMEISAAARVGYVNGEFILNPSNKDLANSSLDLVVAGTKSSVLMVESEASELSEEIMLSAVEFGHKSFAPVIEGIEELTSQAGKPKWDMPSLNIEGLKDLIKDEVSEKILSAFTIKEKLERYSVLGEIKKYLEEKFSESFDKFKINVAFEEVKSELVRHKINTTKTRIDNREPAEIRPINSEVGLLPKAHGSALFTRGETQALVVTTLGTSQDEQIVDDIEGDSRDRFMLQYIFPPYSVNETSPLRAPGRREIGHGKLALRALNAVLPSKEEFPYAMRIVSEITSCNGSSSMATVCGSSMSLMDAGVPLKSPVAGIAMGLIKERENFTILSDIMGDEDHLGDMDFKVAGTKNGITALQMDIKVMGINYDIMREALRQAKSGRYHILSRMEDAISEGRGELSDNAPQIQTLKIEKDKIRELIGPGGKVIKEICEISGAKIDISDDGVVQVAGSKEALEIATARIKLIAFEPEIGDILEGNVVKILDSGAFINISGSKDVYLHISEISHERVKNINDHIKVDDKVKVKVIGYDRGKLKVSMKSFESEPQKVTKSTEIEAVLDDSSISSDEQTIPAEKKTEKSEKPQNTKRRVVKNVSEEEKPVVSERKFFN